MAERKVNSTNYLNQAFLESKCPLNELLFLLSKRWMTDTLFCIEEGNNRFSSIRDELQYISDHILSDRLRLLESGGFIVRQPIDGISTGVQYALTERGSELSSLLEGLCDFASAGVAAAQSAPQLAGSVCSK
ncbi:MAG: helix-turn-helix transcriptional regulator [Bacteroidetes bacterium]|nr:helix-turn-helix transcriptional regulator [Bacteroidota bacterium]